MDGFQKLELVLLLVLLVLVLGILGFGGITGFFVEDKNPVPSDFISEKDIIADNDSITFFIDNPVLSRYENSESMAPFLGKGATGVGFKPESSEDIRVGDVVSFWQDGNIIVHRVIEKGIDKQGVYFITKGDDNYINDGKIRFEEIDSVLVAVIY